MFKKGVKFNLLFIIFCIVSFIGLYSCEQKVEVEKSDTSIIEQVVDTTWKQLSLREKIGQVVCLQYGKSDIDKFSKGNLNKFLTKYPVGSFFIANWELSKYTGKDSLQNLYRKTVTELVSASKHPLLISEDFESGLGSAIPFYTALTSEMGLGATNSIKDANLYSEILASEARSIGINWLLNPVADLNKNPFNFLVNARAIGDDENLAMKLLPVQIKEMQSLGVAATAKHFPGDGVDYINQHFATSAMTLSYKEWEQQHGAVFKKLIDEGVMAIMLGHITFPDYQKVQLNGEYLPATLSKELIVNLLKEKLNFKGVVVSDALNMAGIAGYYKSQLETEIESFKAGTDILLWPKIEIIDTLEARILRKEIPESRLDDAVQRVWNLKNKLGLFQQDYKNIKALSEEELLKNNEKGFEISKKSITLLSNKNNELPFNSKNVKSILVVVISKNEDLTIFEPLRNELIRKGFEVDIRYNLSFFENGAELTQIAQKYDRIIFSFYSAPGNPWGALSNNGNEALTMWSANKLPLEKVISIGFGDPYKNLIYMKRPWVRINCYNVDKNTQKALVQGLIGEIEFTGISPVKVH